jgi:hypothetical protein
MDDGDYFPGFINKLRHSSMISLIRQAGFSVVEQVVEREEHAYFPQPSADDRARFLPHYQDLSPEDVAITAARLLLRPLGGSRWDEQDPRAEPAPLAIPVV